MSFWFGPGYQRTETVDFGDPEVFSKSKKQLTGMMTRDRNRGRVIIWSVGNETLVSPVRTNFMHNLILAAKALDSTRMVSVALETNYNFGKNMNVIDDPLSEFFDLVAFNEYPGWYVGCPVPAAHPIGARQIESHCSSPKKAPEPGLVFTDSLIIFSVEYQEWYYKEQVDMLNAYLPIG